MGRKKLNGGVQGTPNGYLEAESSTKNCFQRVYHIAQAHFSGNVGESHYKAEKAEKRVFNYLKWLQSYSGLKLVT